MKNKNTIRRKTKKANKKINEIFQILKKNENAFNYMNLKLYDVSYYCYDNNINDDIFAGFCEYYYDCFIEELNYQDIDFNDFYNQLGYTSSFLLHDGNYININDLDDTVFWLLQEYYNIYDRDFYLNCLHDFFNIKNQKIIFDRKHYKQSDIIDFLNYINSNDFYNDFMYYNQDIITIYKTIENYKKYQIENFLLWYDDKQ